MRVLFARISWMTWYNGSPEDVPRGQMAFVVERRGPVAERFNFSRIRSTLYGYVTQTGGTPYHLQRIDPSATGVRSLDGVLLVFVAARPAELGGGQVVVGWYRNARLHREYLRGRGNPDLAKRKKWVYCSQASVRNAVLLPTKLRTWQIPTGRGGMGQTKIRYFDARQPWMRRIVGEITQYTGPSLVLDPAVEAEDRAASVGEEAQAGGQGFVLDPALRASIEKRAIEAAKRLYRRAGYEVRVAGRPFDLHCRKPNRGREELWVEVKGYQGQALEVILTRGEVLFYQRRFPRTELFVLHSIRNQRRAWPALAFLSAIGGGVRRSAICDPSRTGTVCRSRAMAAAQQAVSPDGGVNHSAEVTKDQ